MTGGTTHPFEVCDHELKVRPLGWLQYIQMPDRKVYNSLCSLVVFNLSTFAYQKAQFVDNLKKYVGVDSAALLPEHTSNWGEPSNVTTYKPVQP